MIGTKKTKKRRRAEEASEVATPEVEPAAEPALGVSPPVQAEADAVDELLGESATPVRRSLFRPALRHLRWVLLAVPLFGLAAPAYLWIEHKSQHVTSKNAAVRGDLAEIGTRLSGLVAQVAVDVGDRVSAGQVLVQLEDRHLLAEVQEARASVASLQRTIEVERVTIGLERREIARQGLQAEAKVDAAEAQTEAASIEAEDARRGHELRESLHASHGGVSIEGVRDAEARLRTAEARLEEARANAVVTVQSVEQDVRSAEDALTIRERMIAVLEADLQAAEARQLRAEADLEGAAIRAPEDGAVLRRIIQPGGSVEVGQPIITLWLREEVWVEAWIEEEDLGFVRVGSEAIVTLHSFPGQEFTGLVEKIGLATDLELPESDVPQPRFSRMRSAPVVGVRIQLDEPPPNLLPGLSAVVAIER